MSKVNISKINIFPGVWIPFWYQPEICAIFLKISLSMSELQSDLFKTLNRKFKNPLSSRQIQLFFAIVSRIFLELSCRCLVLATRLQVFCIITVDNVGEFCPCLCLEQRTAAFTSQKSYQVFSASAFFNFWILVRYPLENTKRGTLWAS